MGERRPREERHVHFIPRRRGDFRPVRLQPRIRRAEDSQLQLPEPRADAQFQRQELRFEERPAGFGERQPDRGAALSPDPFDGRRHRGGHHARATARATTRSSTASTPRRAARTRRPCAPPSPRRSRSSTTRTTTPRTSARRSSRPFRSRSPTRSSRTR